MIFGKIVLGQPSFLWLVVLILIGFIAATVWSYFKSPVRGTTKILCTFLKLTAIVALGICLLEPLLYGTHPQKGANVMVLLADNSQSLNIADGTTKSRGEQLADALESSPWQTRLEQDFDLRRYTFDSKLESVESFEKVDFQGRSSNMLGALTTVSDRLSKRPMAGIIMFTDGNATDADSPFADNLDQLPPIYPVVLGDEKSRKDLSIADVAIATTSFESAPITVKTQLDQRELENQQVSVELLDSDGKAVVKESLLFSDDEPKKQIRFQFRPESPGISFYQLVAGKENELEDIKKGVSSEATAINNQQTIMVDRGRGPYRVLYVSGRPNWEFKYLRRAMSDDREVELVGLLRIAKKEPKFEFKAREGENNNPLFRGFDTEDEETEEYNKPVIIRFDTKDGSELRRGFPETREELFAYHALILDDVEAKFFTQDQMDLVKQFVNHRGGGFLMLGGQDSYQAGKYQKTPIEDLLPVYISGKKREVSNTSFRMLLSRDGWLQPWVRLRKTQQEETQRLASMPKFSTITSVNRIKPGAEILAFAEDETGGKAPAMVAQSFGNGRTASILIGDLWKWGLHRKQGESKDLESAWRQVVRWLVANTPNQVSIETKPSPKNRNDFEITVKARDIDYKALDNAEVNLVVEDPDGNKINVSAFPDSTAPGTYVGTFSSKETGGYRVNAIVKADDGSDVGSAESGWVFDNALEEMERLESNKTFATELAQKTGGRVLTLEELDGFVRNLPNDKIPVTETRIFPLWHQWFVFWFAAICLFCEWGIRRFQGLP